ncbi:hypothetical protein WJ976_12890 [Achromobacter denitrificans]
MPSACARRHAGGRTQHRRLPGGASPPHELSDADILSVLCDLFAGRAKHAFGETLEWWVETLQCDLSPKAAAGVALTVISKWHFDQRDGAEGVQQLKDELVLRARQLIPRSPRDTGEAA